MINRCQIVYSNSTEQTYSSLHSSWTSERSTNYIKYLIDQKPHSDNVSYLSAEHSSTTERYSITGYKFADGSHPKVSVSVTGTVTSTGLALDFGAITPYAVKVECRSYSGNSYTVVKSQTFTLISSHRISIDDTIEGYNNVYVEYLATYNPGSQVTLKHISFGRDYVFSEDIINAELNESISPEEIAINTSNISVVKPVDISGFERGQKFYIYFPDNEEEYHLIASHTVNDIQFVKHAMTIEGRCAVNKFANKHIYEPAVGINYTGYPKSVWLATIYNEYTDRYSNYSFTGGFKELVTCRTALLHACAGSGKYLDSCGGELSAKPEIKDLFELMKQDYDTATNRYNVDETAIYPGDKIEHTTDYKYCRLYSKTFDSSSEHTSYVTRSSPTSKTTSMKEVETQLFSSSDINQTHTMNALSAYYFSPYRYKVKYQMVDGYQNIGVITRFDLKIGIIEAIPIKRKLNLNGQKIVCDAECIMKWSSL